MDEYAFLTTARVMIRFKAATPAAADERFHELKGGEFSLTATGPTGEQFPVTLSAGLTLTAMTIESGELDQINGKPLDELCRNENCRAPLDGECGSCADRTWLAEGDAV
jgi:hypothetical protein